MARRVDPNEGVSGPRTTSSSSASSSRGGVSWFVPVVTLLLGLVLGAGGMWFAARSDSFPGVSASDSSAPATATPTPAAPTTVSRVEVPASCLKIADESRQMGVVLGRGVTAAKDLDASALSGIVRDFGEKQETIEALARDCQEKGEIPEFATTTN
ncbi:hypothetical protein [Gephyromycinifex aptenodytis]|uniref:hypothetical protein n=1 Tax=Gephyromycinifex aptenodytis TaxID=2716227 RepID=UPI001447A56F|nr:hypothetical protein [Gephyromycinifex aptenodytis]